MTISCPHCQANFDVADDLRTGTLPCSHCQKPIDMAAIMGTKEAAPVEGLNFDDFFELTDKGAAAPAPPTPSAPSFPSAPAASAPPPPPANDGMVIEEVESGVVDDSLMAGLPSIESTETLPAMPPPVVEEFAEEVTGEMPVAVKKPAAEIHNSLDSDFEDLFEDDFKAPAAPAKPAAPSKPKAPAFADPRREPEEEAQSANASSNGPLEELFQAPGAVASTTAKPRTLEPSVSDDDKSFEQLVAQESGNKSTRLTKKWAMVSAATAITLLLSFFGYVFFAPKASVPGFLLGVRRLYHGGPTNKERKAMAEQLVALQEQILEDRYDVYERVVADLEAMIKKDAEQWNARALLVVAKVLSEFDQAQDRNSEKGLQDQLTAVKSAPVKEQPPLGAFAEAFFFLKTRELDKLAAAGAALPASPLRGFLLGEQAWHKGDFAKAKENYQTAPNFRRSQLRLVQLGWRTDNSTSPEAAAATQQLGTLAQAEPPYTLARVLQLERRQLTESAATLSKDVESFLNAHAVRLSPYEKSRLHYLLYDGTSQTVESLKKAYELDPNHDALAHLYGRALLSGDIDQALVLIKKAVALNSTQLTYQASLGEAQRLKGELEASLKTLQDALTVDGKQQDCLLQLANTNLAMGQIADTKKTLGQLLGINPGNIPAKLMYAQIALKENDSKLAIVELRTVLKTAPSNVAALEWLADALILDGDHRQALATIQKAHEIDPKSAALLVKLAKSHALNGGRKEATAFSQQAIQLDPNNKQILLTATETLRELKEFAQAEAAIKKLVELDPKNLDFRALLGKNYIDMGAAPEALATMQEAVLMKSDDFMFRYYLGIAYRMNKNFEQAVAELNKSVIIKSDFKSSYYELAAAYDGLSDFGNALKALENLFRLDPKHIRGTLLAADVYSKVGDYEKSIAFYLKALKNDPSDWQSRVSLGNNYLKVSQAQEAGQTFILALKTNPRAADAYVGLGKIFEDRNEPFKAVTHYLKANQLDSKNTESYYRLGYTYKELGKIREAIAAFKKYLLLDPDSRNKSTIEDELTDLQAR